LKNFFLNLTAFCLGLIVTIGLFFIIDSCFQPSRSAQAKQALLPDSKNDAFFKTFDIEIEQKTKVIIKPDNLISEVQLIRKDNNQVVQASTYHLDTLWRRLPVTKIESDTAIVYLGCSFVFGENLNNNETMPAYAETAMPTVQHINLGLPSLGLNDIYGQLFEDYRLLHMKDAFDPRERYLKLPVKKVILVYYFIGDHLFRSQCSQRCLDDDEVLVRSKPFFEKLMKRSLSTKALTVSISVLIQKFFLPVIFSENLELKFLLLWQRRILRDISYS
jgi:hypothetical protein